jgi:hypothetical protein
MSSPSYPDYRFPQHSELCSRTGRYQYRIRAGSTVTLITASIHITATLVLIRNVVTSPSITSMETRCVMDPPRSGWKPPLEAASNSKNAVTSRSTHCCHIQVIGVGDLGVGREESQLFHCRSFRLSGEQNQRARSFRGAGFLIVPRKLFTPTDLLPIEGLTSSVTMVPQNPANGE